VVCSVVVVVCSVVVVVCSVVVVVCSVVVVVVGDVGEVEDLWMLPRGNDAGCHFVDGRPTVGHMVI